MSYKEIESEIKSRGEFGYQSFREYLNRFPKLGKELANLYFKLRESK